MDTVADENCQLVSTLNCKDAVTKVVLKVISASRSVFGDVSNCSPSADPTVVFPASSPCASSVQVMLPSVVVIPLKNM